MFSLAELTAMAELPLFAEDVLAARRVLVDANTLTGGQRLRLGRFVGALVAALPTEANHDAFRQLCRVGAEICEALMASDSGELARPFRLRASLLYECAHMSPASAALYRNDARESATDLRADLMGRQGPFSSLATEANVAGMLAQYPEAVGLLNQAFAVDGSELAQYVQGIAQEPAHPDALQILARIAASLNVEANVADLRAGMWMVDRRVETSTRRNVTPGLLDQLRATEFPAELFPAQVNALKSGAVDPNIDSWGFGAPTGTGKTSLARLIVVDMLHRQPEAKALYVVPSRALVTEVSETLTKALGELDADVIAVSSQLTDLDESESELYADATVVVLTPEKADMLLRLNAAFLAGVTTVIVDEAHHLEAGTRGALLEMYIWRLRRLLPTARIIWLSAVAPNVREIAEWGGRRAGYEQFMSRPTRMRAGVYRVRGTGRTKTGVIEYVDGATATIVRRDVLAGARRGLVQLAAALAPQGPVLVIAKGKKECEQLAVAMMNYGKQETGFAMLDPEFQKSSVFSRLDSRLEREMYSKVAMRELVKWRIAYHHAGLPPRVRQALEDAIRAGLIKFVFATTTLAEGVNFPFHSVIVQSLWLTEPPDQGRPARSFPVTPRTFWNIAGRAGRPGTDREGQVVLYSPSLSKGAIALTLADYLEPAKLAPVRSALGDAVGHVRAGVQSGEYAFDELGELMLPPALPRRVHGALNLIRVGLIHARAANLGVTPHELVEGLFARKFWSVDETKFAHELFSQQEQAVSTYLATNNSVPLEVVAKLGLSISTLSALQQYASEMSNWQIENLAQLFYGPLLNLRQCPYVVGPIAKRMAELEGPVLGGWYSDVIVQWLSGASVSGFQLGNSRIEDLISVIHSRVQFLLPWGLYAFDALLELEAQSRGVAYDNTIARLAYLVDAGVPSFDALRLTKVGFERVDATRLANAYRRAGGLRTGADIMRWVGSKDFGSIAAIVTGSDSRRADFDLEPLVKRLRALSVS